MSIQHSRFAPFLIAALLLLTAPPLRAQESGEWVAYTSMRNIRDLLVQPDAIWAMTTGGLLRFDRQSRTYSRFTRIDGLAGNQIYSGAVDDRGHLWFGTLRSGLSRFRPEEQRFDPPFLDFVDLRITALVAHGDRLFVGTERGISAFLIDKEEVKENYRQLGKIPKDTEVEALAVYQNKLWAGTASGVAWADLDSPNLQDPENWHSYPIGRIRKLLVHDDTLYCASSRGIWNISEEVDKPAIEMSGQNVVALGLFAGKVTAVTLEGVFFQRRAKREWIAGVSTAISGPHAIAKVDDALWVATESGLRVVGGESPPPSREPTASHFYDLELSPDGQLWAASVPKDTITPFGLYQYDGEGWTVHNLKSGLSSEFVTSVETDARGLLWVGNWGQGIDIFDGSGTWHRLNYANSVLEGIGASSAFVAISGITRDAEGLMWASNVQIGLAVFDGYPPNQSHLYPVTDLGLSSGRDTGAIAIGPDRLKWISTPRDGFLLFDDGGTPFESGDEYARLFDTLSESELTSDRTSAILVDRRGRVWVGTDNGLNRITGTYDRTARRFQVEDWRVYNSANGLPVNSISALEEDTSGNIWVGTEAGLAQITPSGEPAFTLTTTNSGLIANSVNSLLFDPESGDLWIGTYDGLSRLKVERGSGGGSAEGAAVYPNPFLIGERTATLTFAGLPLGASLDIFTLAGRLVRHIEGVPGQGALQWNGQNEAGFLIGSGIYFFVAQDEAGARARGRFAVVNRP